MRHHNAMAHFVHHLMKIMWWDIWFICNVYIVVNKAVMHMAIFKHAADEAVEHI